MSHKQTDIRDALKNLLLNNTVAQARVYKNPTHNTVIHNLPSIKITDGPETPTPRDVRTTQYIRNWSVNLILQLEANSNFDSLLDDFTLEVENLIFANRTLGGLVLDISYLGSDPDYDGSGQKTIATKTLTFNIKYIQ